MLLNKRKKMYTRSKVKYTTFLKHIHLCLDTINRQNFITLSTKHFPDIVEARKTHDTYTSLDKCFSQRIMLFFFTLSSLYKKHIFFTLYPLFCKKDPGKIFEPFFLNFPTLVSR